MAKKMTDDAIVARLTYAVGQAVGFAESKLARERQKVRRLYDGEKPEKISPGDSGYVSRDVYDAVEAMKAQLLEVISATHHPLTFLPQQGEDSTAGQARADWCNHVLYTQNPGFSLLQTVIDDGLMSRNGIAKVYWKKDVRTETYDLSDTNMEELQAHMGQNPKDDIEDYTFAEDGVSLKRVRMTKTTDRSRIVVEPVPPEEFGISPMAKSIADAEVVIHRRRMTMSDLLHAGYEKDKLDEVQSDDKAFEASDGDRYQRFTQTDDMVGDDELGEGSEARRRFLVVEAYAELDIDGTGKSRLHKVTYIGATLLDKEPVERTPFVDFAPLPRAHAFWGTNYARLLEATQTARTYLTRSIINHALITNNPRLQVVRGAVANPRELMENRLGGIVNVTRPDGIAPIPQQGLNPFVFQTIGLLDTDKEEMTGISKLSQGLSKEAISSQNSQGMVDQLINASQTRQKVIARNFAEHFLRHLFTMIYKLTLENEDTKKIISVSGTWVPVDFTTWPDCVEVEVSMTLGLTAQQTEAQKWLGMHKSLASDPIMSAFYPKEKAYAVYCKAMKAAGITNVNDYLLTPDKVQPPQPTPMMLADLAVKQADAAVKQASAQAATANSALHAQEAADKKMETMRKIDLAERKESDHAQNSRDMLAHRVAVDAAELVLSNQALAVDKLTATAQPKG